MPYPLRNSFPDVKGTVESIPQAGLAFGLAVRAKAEWEEPL
jgi:hypothetical protein